MNKSIEAVRYGLEKPHRYIDLKDIQALLNHSEAQSVVIKDIAEKLEMLVDYGILCIGFLEETHPGKSQSLANRVKEAEQTLKAHTDVIKEC